MWGAALHQKWSGQRCARQHSPRCPPMWFQSASALSSRAARIALTYYKYVEQRSSCQPAGARLGRQGVVLNMRFSQKGERQGQTQPHKRR